MEAGTVPLLDSIKPTATETSRITTTPTSGVSGMLMTALSWLVEAAYVPITALVGQKTIMGCLTVALNLT